MMDKYFNYRKNKTTFKTEIIAGVTTFLTMAYIMILNPLILSDGGFSFGGVFVATAVTSAVACIAMGLYARTWAVGLAPGMGINAFVAYGVCGGMGFSPAEALGAVVVSGVVFLAVSLTLLTFSSLLITKRRYPFRHSKYGTPVVGSSRLAFILNLLFSLLTWGIIRPLLYSLW